MRSWQVIPHKDARGPWILTNEPVFAEDKFLGFLEAPLSEMEKGIYCPLTEKDIKNFLPALNSILGEKKV